MNIAFYKGRKRLRDRAIAWWLRGNYSHCELVLGIKDGRAICMSSSMMDGGVRIKYMHLDRAHWDLVPVSGDPAKAWAWLREHDGQGYDYLGLAGFAARVLGHSKTRWLCSEAVADMLGMPEAWRFDPCSLWAAVSRQASQPTQPAQAGFFYARRKMSMEPTSSGTAAGIAGWKLIGGLAGLGAIGAALAAIVVMCMTPPRDPREWVVGIVSTVVASIGGGAAVVQWLDLQRWAESHIGLVALFGLVFACGLPGWAVVRWVFNAIRRREGQGIDQVIREARNGQT